MDRRVFLSRTDPSHSFRQASSLVLKRLPSAALGAPFGFAQFDYNRRRVKRITGLLPPSRRAVAAREYLLRAWAHWWHSVALPKSI